MNWPDNTVKSLYNAFNIPPPSNPDTFTKRQKVQVSKHDQSIRALESPQERAARLTAFKPGSGFNAALATPEATLRTAAIRGR